MALATFLGAGDGAAGGGETCSASAAASATGAVDPALAARARARISAVESLPAGDAGWAAAGLAAAGLAAGAAPEALARAAARISAVEAFLAAPPGGWGAGRGKGGGWNVEAGKWQHWADVPRPHTNTSLRIPSIQHTARSPQCSPHSAAHPHDAEDLAGRGHRHLNLLGVARLARSHKHGRILQQQGRQRGGQGGGIQRRVRGHTAVAPPRHAPACARMLPPAPPPAACRARRSCQGTVPAAAPVGGRGAEGRRQGEHGGSGRAAGGAAAARRRWGASGRELAAFMRAGFVRTLACVLAPSNVGGGSEVLLFGVGSCRDVTRTPRAQL